MGQSGPQQASELNREILGAVIAANWFTVGNASSCVGVQVPDGLARCRGYGERVLRLINR